MLLDGEIDAAIVGDKLPDPRCGTSFPITKLPLSGGPRCTRACRSTTWWWSARACRNRAPTRCARCSASCTRASLRAELKDGDPLDPYRFGVEACGPILEVIIDSALAEADAIPDSPWTSCSTTTTRALTIGGSVAPRQATRRSTAAGPMSLSSAAASAACDSRVRAERGARVTRLERAAREERGGQTRYTEAYFRMKSDSEVTTISSTHLAANGSATSIRCWSTKASGGRKLATAGRWSEPRRSRFHRHLRRAAGPTVQWLKASASASISCRPSSSPNRSRGCCRSAADCAGRGTGRRGRAPRRRDPLRDRRRSTCCRTMPLRSCGVRASTRGGRSSASKPTR